jgi:hypothetical protein
MACCFKYTEQKANIWLSAQELFFAIQLTVVPCSFEIKLVATWGWLHCRRPDKA